MAEGAHALLAPSRAGQWVHCGGSVALQRRYPETEEGEDAKAGTAAHWAGAEMLAGRMVAEGQITPAGTVLTGEMIEAAEVWSDDVRKVLAGQQLVAFQVEQPVSMRRRIHPENWGTPDTWAYSAAVRTLWLWDFKFGHEFVDAYTNWQLIDYAAGCAEAAGINTLQATEEQHTQVVMTIIQPRNYDREGPVRRWVVPLRELRAHFNRLEMAAEDATSATPSTKAGPWCRHCSARHACQTLQRDGYVSATLATGTVAVDLPPAAAALELRMLEDAADRLNSRITGLRANVEMTIRQGNTVPGWAVEPSTPREQWTIPVEDVIAHAKLCGIDAAKPGVMTPPQLRKAGMPEEYIATISKRAAGTLKLVRDENTRTRRILDGFVK